MITNLFRSLLEMNNRISCYRHFENRISARTYSVRDYRIQQALKQLRIDLKDYLPLLLPLLFP